MFLPVVGRYFSAQLIGAAKLIDRAPRPAQGGVGDARPKSGQSPIASASLRYPRLDQNLVNSFESLAGP
jgi:hypothetical protein